MELSQDRCSFALSKKKQTAKQEAASARVTAAFLVRVTDEWDRGRPLIVVSHFI